jgi:hypothetical protein
MKNIKEMCQLIDFSEIRKKYMRHAYLLAAVSIATLVGCASTAANTSRVAKTEDENKIFACIETESPNIFIFYVNGGAKVVPKKVDNKQPSDSIAFTENRVCFAAGEHKIGITASTSSESVNEYITYQFEAAKKYKITAKVEGITFNLLLSDVTNTPEVLLKEFNVKISGSGGS